MLLVYGPRSTSYDFGPGHPLTPRRFGPGIDLLRAVGAEPGLAPEPATDDELMWCHTRRYLEVVKRFSRDPYGPPAAGIGSGDDPPFAGMHDAGAMVAGGSLRAMEAVLRGDVDHAFHPGGGLHHAMPDRASGFCIYDDPALAIARARREGLRVLYVDLDVHHGDGVQAIHWDDPDVLTLSFHESGRYLFPGTGGVGELGEGVAAGTAVNVPLEPGTGEGPWLEAVRTLLPEVAAAFGPDIVVSQHGADSHAWDPLAHLRVTTTAMGEAARLVDAVAHRWAGGRWLATGGGGYDAYRVVPRTWSLVWLAGAHRDVPAATPVAWRERWAEEAARYGQVPLPKAFSDPPNAGEPIDWSQEEAEAVSRRTAALVRRLVVPRLLREASDRGWWDALGSARPDAGVGGGAGPEAGVGAGPGADAGTSAGVGAGPAARAGTEAGPAAGAGTEAGVGAGAGAEAGTSAGVRAGPSAQAGTSAGVRAGPGGATPAAAATSADAGALAGAHSPEPVVVDTVDPETWDRLSLAPGVIPPLDTATAHALIAAGLRDGLALSAAVTGATVVGIVATLAPTAIPGTDGTPQIPPSRRDLVALGVAAAWRRHGLAGNLLTAHLAATAGTARHVAAEVTVSERDPLDPLDRGIRAAVARRLLERAGFRIVAAAPDVRAADPGVVTAEWTAGAGPA